MLKAFIETRDGRILEIIKIYHRFRHIPNFFTSIYTLRNMPNLISYRAPDYYDGKDLLRLFNQLGNYYFEHSKGKVSCANVIQVWSEEWSDNP